MVGLAETLNEGLIAVPAVDGDACWRPSCLLNSTISLSISAFLLRFPTLLKFDSILHSRLRRWHRVHVVYSGSVTTSHRSWPMTHQLCSLLFIRRVPDPPFAAGIHYKPSSPQAASSYPQYCPHTHPAHLRSNSLVSCCVCL